MIWFHLLIVLLFIIVGARLGGIGIGRRHRPGRHRRAHRE